MRITTVLTALMVALALASPARAPAGTPSAMPPPVAPGALRIATYNASLNRREAGALARGLAARDDAQARTIAAVLQEVRPDLLLINEFDYDGAMDDDHASRPPAPAALAFLHDHLEVGQGGRAPLPCPTLFSAPSNTGIPTGVDLDHDGRVGGGNDARGFGLFPGQYGMLVCSRLALRREAVRSFRKFLWRDMPGADLPPGWYGPEALAVLPLSS
ncbi:MAG: endonuclease/exonuclease/phosphatase family protein, partial [Gammaproteobacteria bacterium]|nr:endonuclease/exonuclease/phosphatase family protein [Gammaproteobacteria bacterium]